MDIFKKRDKENTELSVKLSQEEQRNLKLIGSLIPHKGHQVFKICKTTLYVSKPLYEKTMVYDVNKSIKENLPKLIVEEGYSYVVALNETNALKKYNKEDNGSKFNK